MQTNLSRGIREGVIAGAAGGFAGSWLFAIALVLNAQVSTGADVNEFLQSLLLGFVIGFVGMFIGTPIGAFVGVVVGGFYGVFQLDRSAPYVTAALLGGALPLAVLVTAGSSVTETERGASTQWAVGLLVIGLMAGLGYGAGVIWRNGMRSRRTNDPSSPPQPPSPTERRTYEAMKSTKT